METMGTAEIYQSLKETFTERRGESFRDDGDLGIRMQIVAGELAELYRQVSYLEQQIFPQTATGTYLEQHGVCRNILRKAADGAKGLLLFSRTIATREPLEIPAGIICTDSAGSGNMYVTTKKGILPAGALDVFVEAKAEGIGPETNIAANQIDTIVTAVSGIDGVTNPENFTGGCEIEPEEVYRRRVVESFSRISTGANLKFYEEIALNCDGVWSAKAVAADSSNQVTLYIADRDRTTPDSLVTAVQAAVDRVREVGIRVTVTKAKVVTQTVDVVCYANFYNSVFSLKKQIETYLRGKVQNLKIGEAINPFMMTADLTEQIPECTGMTFYEPFSRVALKEGEIAQPGEILISISAEGSDDE